MPLLKLLVAFFFVAMNAFFVLSEFALVKIRKTRLEELSKQGNHRADVSLRLVNNLDSYLSAMQLGITLASLALGWLGEPAIAYLIRPLFEKLSIGTPVLIHTVSIAVAFTFITFMHVVLGELVPKSVAIQQTERVVLFISLPMLLFHKLVYPIVYLFDHIASFSLRLLGMTPSKDSEQVHSEEELKMLVNASHTDGVLDDTEGRIIGNMFGFADKIAREVMIPRTDMLCLYLDDSYEDSLKEVLGATFTRFPLCRTDKDNVIGMIHLRDILENETNGHGEEHDLEKLGREVLFVPETQHITNIMQLMRKKQIHMAVVIDEYGGTAGIITLEDIIEEIVGDINDEYDHDAPDIHKIAENTYEINGLTEQGTVEDLLDIDLGDQDDETIGGFVFSLLGRKAEKGDKVNQCGYVFEVIEVNGLRISKIQVHPEPKAEEVTAE